MPIDRWSDIPNGVIPHGHYRSIIGDISTDTLSATKEKPRLLFFGAITKYKNGHKLLRTFLKLPHGTAHLSMKGELSKVSPDSSLLLELESMSESQRANVSFENRFLSDAELVSEIVESDIVVFPYSDVLNSGAAIFALSVGRPILCSDTPLFRELRSKIGEDWVLLFNGELNPDCLVGALKHAANLKRSGALPDLSHYGWESIAKKTSALYVQLLK